MSEHELWNELGNLYFLSGSYEQAVHAYTRATALDRDFGHPYGNMAQAYERMGRYTEAIDLYRRSICLLVGEREKAMCWYKLGDIHLHLRNYQQAVEAYQQAEALVPDVRKSVDAWDQSAELLNRKPTADDLIHLVKQDREAESEAQDNLLLDSTSGMELLPFIEELTPWWFDGQTAPQEEPSFDYNLPFLAESIVPGFDENTFKVREQTAKTSQFAMQEQHSLEVETLVADPDAVPIMVIADDPEIVTEVPEYSTHNFAGPEVVQYETPVEMPVAELTPEERTAIQLDINKFKRLLETNLRDSTAWDTLGGKYKALGEYDDAINAFQNAVEFDSSNASYFHHLGLVYAAVGRYEDAIAAFEIVIEIDPDHNLAHAALGGYYRKKGKEAQAQAHIEIAKGLLSANDENEYNRACFEAICGNIDRALELLEIALKDKRTYVNWARRDPDLDFIRDDPRFHALLAEYATRPT